MATTHDTDTTRVSVFRAITEHLETNPGLTAPLSLNAISDNAPRLQVFANGFRNWIQSADSYIVASPFTSPTGSHHIEADAVFAGQSFTLVTATEQMSFAVFAELVDLNTVKAGV